MQWCSWLRPFGSRGSGHCGEAARRAAYAGLVARLHALLALVIAASAIGACGGDEDGGTAKAPARPAITTLPGDPGTGVVDRAAVDVVRRWSDALRHGDVAGATAFFAIPSRASNGDGVVRLNSAADARAFNESLPCGARLTTV